MSTELLRARERKAMLLIIIFIFTFSFPFLTLAFIRVLNDINASLSEAGAFAFAYTVIFLGILYCLCRLYAKPLVENWVDHSWRDIKSLAKQKGLCIHKKLDRHILGDDEKIQIFKNNEKIFEFVACTDTDARIITLDFILNFKDSEKQEGSLETKEQVQETKIEDDTSTQPLGTTPPAQIMFGRWVYKGTRYSLLAEAEIEETFVFIKYGVLSEQKDGYKVFKACDRNCFIKKLSSSEIHSLKDWEEKWRLWCVDNWRDFSTSLSLI